MQLKMSTAVMAKEKFSYATGKEREGSVAVDCAAGFNPYGVSPQVPDALKNNLTPENITEYPHGLQLQRAIAQFWQPYAQVTEDNILLTDGSIGALYLINQAFAAPGAAVLTAAPQFSDYTAHAKYLNIRYRPVYLKAESNYRIDIDEMIARVNSDLSLIYLDNPNNPTGQLVTLGDLKKLIQTASERRICVVIDEAYGDFAEQEASAACLLGDFKNLIVLRSFSKGLGMAGLRAGYLLASPQICTELSKLACPYAISQPVRIAACAALKDIAFVRKTRKAVAKNKQLLLRSIGNKLQMAHSFEQCPICLLIHVDPQCDLKEMLLAQGILAYSGACFDGLQKNSVRLRLPREDAMPSLLAALRMIDAG